MSQFSLKNDGVQILENLRKKVINVPLINFDRIGKMISSSFRFYKYCVGKYCVTKYFIEIETDEFYGKEKYGE